MPDSTRFTGTISLGTATDEAPVTKVSYDIAEYEKVILSSWEKVQAGHQAPAVGVTLPLEAIATARSRFVEAAKRRGLGVTFMEHTHESTRGKQLGLQPGQVRLVLEAKSRKVMTARTDAQRKAAAEKARATRAAKKSGIGTAVPAQGAAKSAGLPKPR